MAKLLQLRRGTTTQHGSFTGAEGEVTIDTTKDTAVVHDGSQAGGRPLLREDMANLPAGTIDNADVNASAAIAGTKISPDFGSQNIATTGNITTTGKVLFANVYTNESDLPSASTYHGMFAHVHSTGLGYYAHGGSWIKLAKLDAPDFTGGIDVTGNITATGTIDGRDVAADGTKLDGIESGATADQTKSDIDGLNINADQVDGIHAASFVRNDSGNQTIAGDITVGSGTSSYIYMVDTDHGNRTIHNNSDQIGFLKQDGNWGAHLDDSGNWTAVGNVTAYSDQKLKTNVNTINDALSIVGKLRGVSFDWKESGKHSIGVIAQEVEEVLPELVVTNRTTVPNTGETTEIKSVDYGKIVGVLINAINELKAEVDELKKPKKKGGK